MRNKIFPLHNPTGAGCSCGNRECNSIGKHPITKDGFKSATSDQEQIQKWQLQFPKANWGIATGIDSGVFVLDVDFKSGGEKSLEDLISEFGPLPKTYTVRTGNGIHYYFQCNSAELKNRSAIFPGLDIRANGGYVVAPGSKHANGKMYQIAIECEPSPAPDWLLSLLENKPSNEIKMDGKIHTGSRNDRLFRIATSLHAKGVVGGDLHDVISTLNEKLCDEPLSMKEIDGIIQSASRYESKPQAPIELISVEKLLKEEALTDEWLVDELLIQSGLGTLNGKPKAGKSCMARQLAVAIAKGGDFLGRKAKQGVVLYLALEEKRSEVKKHFEKMQLDAVDAGRIHIVFQSLGKDWITQIRHLASIIHPSLIIIDTLFKVVRIKDSSNYLEVNYGMEPLLELARETRAFVLCVHHMGKSDRKGADGVIGSTAITGAGDVNLFLERKDSNGIIYSQTRYGEDLEETIVNFDKESKSFSIGTPVRTAAREDLENRMLAILQSAGRSLSQSEWIELVEGATQRKHSCIRDLVGKGYVVETGNGTSNDPYRYEMPFAARLGGNIK